jgi:hypothetical protein
MQVSDPRFGSRRLHNDLMLSQNRTNVSKFLGQNRGSVNYKNQKWH